MAEKTAAQKSLEVLATTFQYDPVASQTIIDAMQTLERYIEQRNYHISLMKADPNEYDAVATKAADAERTRCHNAAIRAVVKLSALAEAASLTTSIPALADVDNPFIAPYRDIVARFAYEYCGLPYQR